MAHRGRRRGRGDPTGFLAWQAWVEEWVHVAVPAVTALLGLWVLVTPFVFQWVTEWITCSNAFAGSLVSVPVGSLGRVDRVNDRHSRG
ncbi:MAG: hypothetical protein ACLFM8_07205, partial [Halobacteriales archaeon]